MMKTLHLILQGKGGVGKSLVASLLCQYLKMQLTEEESDKIKSIDTDPVNHTLSGYKTLKVKELEIRSGDNIDQRKFDELMEIVASADDDNQIVIDNGAATFMPLCAWMTENQTVELWQEEGMRVVLHCVITGGQAMQDTIKGFKALTESFNSEIMVWLNQYFGEINFKGKKFQDFELYQKNKGKVSALINIPQKTKETFGKDLEELFARRQTFADAITDTTLPIMVRHRLKIWWNEMCTELDKSNINTMTTAESS